MIDWTPELEDSICAGIATSDRGLQHLAQENSWPDPATIYRHISQSEEFRDKYARARKEQAQLLADQIVSIADTTQEGEIVTEKPDGTSEIKRADMIEHRKLRIESRKWLAMKLLPKVYGDKVQQELTGANGGPIQAAVTVEFVKPKAE